MGLKIFHNAKESRRFEIGEGYHLTFQRKELPDAGAMQYAYETFGMPMYSPIGPTVRVHNPRDRFQPASYVFQAVSLVGMPPTSVLQGQSANQPLMDPTLATALGLSAQQPPISPLLQLNGVGSQGNISQAITG